jgi:intracellular multiplication protein IcmV
MAVLGFLKVFLPSGKRLKGEYQDLKNQNLSLRRMLTSLYSKDVLERKETFEQAMVRLGLTEADIHKTARNYHIYALIFLILGLALFVYAFYLLFAYLALMGCLLGLTAAAFSWGQAFRFDFWSCQIRKRKLGLTFNEWKQSYLGTQRT